MYLGKADVNTYDKGAGREFLISNGRGSYGFSTVIGANTRREHGLLVVRNGEEKQHSVLVSKIEETLFDRNKKYQLSTKNTSFRQIDTRIWFIPTVTDTFRNIREIHIRACSS